MSNYTAESERTLGQIVKDLTADVSTLFRSEIALLKLEIKDAAAKLGGGAGLLGAALFLGLFGLAFLFVTITLGLVALGVPAWLSSLIVTVVLLGAAAALGLMGKKKLGQVNFVPTEAIDHMKSDVDMIKADIARVRSR
ncbi:MAG TPA: phage holin family protein [Thermoanaerobaculia bacterium]|jgi:uncharacterized membrane protein YqjE